MSTSSPFSIFSATMPVVPHPLHPPPHRSRHCKYHDTDGTLSTTHDKTHARALVNGKALLTEWQATRSTAGSREVHSLRKFRHHSTTSPSRRETRRASAE
eukprot:6205557-Pleurochrysis_carterae.AAC.1